MSGDGARPARAAAMFDLVAVALHNLNRVQRDAGIFIEKLAVDRLMALTVGLRAHVKPRGALAGEFYFRGFIG